MTVKGRIRVGLVLSFLSFSPAARAQIGAVSSAPDLDIREGNVKGAADTLALHLAKFGAALPEKNATAQEALARAEAKLASRVAGLDIQFSPRTQTAEVVGVSKGKGSLRAASALERDPSLRAFIAQNLDLYGLTNAQVTELRSGVDYSNPNGNLRLHGHGDDTARSES